MNDGGNCPNCGYHDPAFGSTNGRISCGNCGHMWDPDEVYEERKASGQEPLESSARPSRPSGPKDGSASMKQNTSSRSKTADFTKSGNRPQRANRPLAREHRPLTEPPSPK